MRKGVPHACVPQVYESGGLYRIVRDYGKTEREKEIIRKNSGKPYHLVYAERMKNERNKTDSKVDE